MDNPIIWLIGTVVLLASIIVMRLDEALREFRSIRRTLEDADLKSMAVEQAGQGAELRSIAYELYLLRRITEEKTGFSDADVKATDEKRRAGQLEQLQEAIARRDSSGVSS